MAIAVIVRVFRQKTKAGFPFLQQIHERRIPVFPIFIPHPAFGTGIRPRRLPSFQASR
jgi:hypothetical protein